MGGYPQLWLRDSPRPLFLAYSKTDGCKVVNQGAFAEASRVTS